MFTPTFGGHNLIDCFAINIVLDELRGVCCSIERKRKEVLVTKLAELKQFLLESFVSDVVAETVSGNRVEFPGIRSGEFWLR